jgi:serine/threonine protein phosphatase PrpC
MTTEFIKIEEETQKRSKNTIQVIQKELKEANKKKGTEIEGKMNIMIENQIMLQENIQKITQDIRNKKERDLDKSMETIITLHCKEKSTQEIKEIIINSRSTNEFNDVRQRPITVQENMKEFSRIETQH